MESTVDLVFYFAGTWKYKDEKLQYVDGETDILYDFDPDFLYFDTKTLMALRRLKKYLCLNRKSN